MGSNIRDELYQLVFSPMVKPENLLDNIRLENYKSVSFSRTSDGLMATMKCAVENEICVFIYRFDEREYLQRVEMKSPTGWKTVFDRREATGTVHRLLDLKETRPEVAV